jgi:hypothetical protein
MYKNEIYNNNFIKSIVFWGSVTNLIAFFLVFLPAIYLWLVWDALPPASAVISGALSVILGFSGVLWIVEPISYFPILGIPGTYMAFLSGNISNMRVPCSAIAQEAAGVEEGSQEGTVISVLGVGASVYINVIVMIVGAIVGARLVANFPPLVSSALKYILPAVFGGVFGQFALKNFKAAIIAFILACLANIGGFLPQYIALPVCIFLTIFFGIQMEKRKNARNTDHVA